MSRRIRHRSRSSRWWSAAFGAAGLTTVLVTAGLPSLGAAQAAVPAPDPGWATVWSDDFNGPANQLPSSTLWRIDTGHQYTAGSAPDWGTGEVENYTKNPANVSLDGAGHLQITPTYDAATNTWSSGRIESNREDFQPPQGGMMKVSARIKLPDVMGSDGVNHGKGYWPAFWMLGAPFRHTPTYFGRTYSPYTSWPMAGEFDIMEDILNGPTAGHPEDWGKGNTATMHCGWLEYPGTSTVDPTGGPCHEYGGISHRRDTTSYLWNAYHTYSVVWDRSGPVETLSWYLDSDPDPVLTVTPASIGDTGTYATGQQVWANATKHGFFLLLNLAMGGAFPSNQSDGGPDATTQPGHPMKVDYVAVYTKAGGTTASSSPSASSSPTAPAVRSAYSQLQAESYAAKQGDAAIATISGTTSKYVGPLGNGDWLKYPKVDFGSTPAKQFSARVQSDAAAGVSGLVQVRLDSPTAPVVGEFATGAGPWQTVPANMNDVTGVHDVYLTFTSGQPADFTNVDWFTFAH